MNIRHVLSLTFLCALLLGMTSPAHSNDPGFKPRNLDISRHGSIVVATSWGSTSVSQFRRNATTGALSSVEHISVGEASWDVVILDANDTGGNLKTWAVITHPDATKLTVLEASADANGPTFTGVAPAYRTGIPRNATAIIASPNPGCVLIAFRGVSPSGPAAADSWTHRVKEYNFVFGYFTGKDFTTEREPSSLAMSPDDEILYVGHIQGALGQDGLHMTDTYFAGNAQTVFDGGSILAFDFATTSTVARYPVGSPVRDVKVFPPKGTDPADYPDDLDPPSGGDAGEYVLYFTHVGDGSQSEHPVAGGRVIPNVISGILFAPDHSTDHTVSSTRQDVIFNHNPAYPSMDQFVLHDSAAVLPEQIDFHYDGTDWFAWVTFSGSGMVGKAPMGPDGRVTAPDVYSLDTTGLWVVTGRGSDKLILRPRDEFVKVTEVNQTMTLDFGLVDGGELIRVDQASTSNHRIQSSNPRGIVVDAENDRVMVVTQFDGELVDINALNSTKTRLCLLGGSCVPNNNRGVAAAERNFFTFGRGFDFREPGTKAESVLQPDDPVDNLTCGTCHVNGHLDGKVRLSALPKINAKNPDVPSTKRIGTEQNKIRTFKPIAVPSVFDTGSSEWLFFEGLQTTRDALGQDDGLEAGCGYCSFNFAGIFLNTHAFATTATTPSSPYDTGVLDAPQARGRDVFEELNCSRCHSGDLFEPFLRTPELAGDLPNADPMGPIFGFNGQSSSLSDPTQVFLQETTPAGVGLSARNMTVVGSRPANEAAQINGVNTPSLFGAWDNAPYLHDGRYRTLAEVLDHTWLDTTTGLSAPLLPTADAFPDNLTNKYFDGVNLGDSITQIKNDITANGGNFGTHAHTNGSAQSVSSALSQSDLDALLAFLSAVSSEADLDCPTQITVSGVAYTTSDYDPVADTATMNLTWQTSFTAGCEVRLSGTGVDTTLVTAGEMSHELAIEDIPLCADYTVEVTPFSRLCGVFSSTQSTVVEFYHPISGLEAENIVITVDPECGPTQITWTTDECVPSTIEWGLKLKGAGFPNSATTPAGTVHTVNIPVQQNKKYKARITPEGGGLRPTRTGSRRSTAFRWISLRDPRRSFRPRGSVPSTRTPSTRAPW